MVSDVQHLALRRSMRFVRLGVHGRIAERKGTSFSQNRKMNPSGGWEAFCSHQQPDVTPSLPRRSPPCKRNDPLQGFANDVPECAGDNVLFDATY